MLLLNLLCVCLCFLLSLFLSRFSRRSYGRHHRNQYQWSKLAQVKTCRLHIATGLLISDKNNTYVFAFHSCTWELLAIDHDQAGIYPENVCFLLRLATALIVVVAAFFITNRTVESTVHLIRAIKQIVAKNDL